MKKHPWLTTVGVCAALLAVLFLISPYIGFVGEMCSKNEYTGDKECAGYDLAQYAILWIAQILDAHNGFVTALASVAVAWFTATLYWASVEQGRLTQQSIDLARQEFVSTHRPRIILREAIIGSVLEGEPIHTILNIANIGETDGSIVCSTVDLEIVNMSSPDRLFMLGSVEPHNELGKIFLRPGESRLIGWDQLNKRDRSPPAPNWEANKFKIKTYIGPGTGPDGFSTRRTGRDFEIHLCGQFIYEDRAGIHRRTAFRRRLVPERQRFYRLQDEPDLDYAD